MANIPSSYYDRYTLETWFERDRAHVGLTDSKTGKEVVDWWDDDVRQLVEDGFLDPRDWHGSAIEYAMNLGLIPGRVGKRIIPRPKRNPGARWHGREATQAEEDRVKAEERGSIIGSHYYRGKREAHRESQAASRQMGMNNPSERFAKWEDAHAAAQHKANTTGMVVAIRKTREFGRTGYNVTFASRDDLHDYRVEVVRPETKRNPGASWHQEQEQLAEAMEKRETRPRRKTYLRGMADAHALSAHESRKAGLNPRGSEADATAARELLLFIESNEKLYRQQWTPIIQNLDRKVRRGVYDREKAVKLFLYLADNGAREYNREVMGGKGIPAFFTRATRLVVARQLKDQYEEDRFGDIGPPKSNPRGARRRGNPSSAYDVFLRGKKIDTVFWSDPSSAEEVKRSLVEHDGYDPEIRVLKQRKKRTMRPNPDIEMTFNAKAKAVRYAAAMRKLGHDIEVVKGQYGTWKTIIHEPKKNPIAVYNPPAGKIIYGRVLAVEAQKTNGSYKGKRFRHSFAGDSRVQAYALPDGSVLLKSAAGKRLWQDR